MERSQYLAQALQAMMAQPQNAPQPGLPATGTPGAPPAGGGLGGLMQNLQRLGGRMVPGQG